MSATLIGVLLDCALEFAWTAEPRAITLDPAKFGLSDLAATRLDPRSVARSLLANRLREYFDETANGKPTRLEAGCSYADIDAACRRPRLLRDTDLRDPDHQPDVVWMPSGGSLHVIESGYGFVADEAMAALDRLLNLHWIVGPSYAHPTVDFVAYVFVYEMRSEEFIGKVERQFMDWIEAHYGPLHGIKRIGLPMMPRLSRTATLLPRDGTVVSAIDLETRPGGFVAFCISYDHTGF